MAPTVAAQPPMSTTQHSVDLFRSFASLYHGSLRSELQINLASMYKIAGTLSPYSARSNGFVPAGLLILITSCPGPTGSMDKIYRIHNYNLSHDHYQRIPG